MKTKSFSALLRTAFPFILFLAFPIRLCAQGTAFTYQGRLNDGASPASGTYDFRFKLFQDALGNNQAGATQLAASVLVSNGLFTVTIDFGAGFFTGSNYWLDVGVRTNGGGGYTDLTPLQPIMPTPYAMFADTASNLSGTLPAAQLTGMVPSANLTGLYGNAVTFSNAANSFSGNGTNLTGVNAASLNGLGSASFWQTAGNAGTTAGVNFVGTVDNQPLELHVNGQRALQLLPDSSTNNAPDIVGGSISNFVTPGLVGTIIAGGSWNTVGPASLFSSNNPYGDTVGYSVGASYSTIGGGFLNQIQNAATFSTIAGGAINTIQSSNVESTIGGGFGNTIISNAYWSTIAGGTHHVIGSFNGFIGGGWDNKILTNSAYAAIAGGLFNNIEGNALDSFIGGGDDNIIGPNGIGGGGSYSTIGGGYFNSVYESASFIGGGSQNSVAPFADHAAIGGGGNNIINGSAGPNYGVIGGGYQNLVQTNTSYATIGGGDGNTIQSNALYAVIPGGSNNLAGGYGSLAAGSRAQATNDGAFVWSDASSVNAFNSTGPNQFLVRAAGGVGIGTNNPSAALHVVGGGGANTALRVDNGSIAVSGAGIGTGTAAFVQLTSAANINGDSSYINNPICNGDPNAILLVTHNYNPGEIIDTYFDKNFGVWFNALKNEWAVYTEDESAMPTNIAFNVLIIKK